MPFKNNNSGLVNLKSQNTRKVVGKLPIPTFIPTSAQDFLDVTATSKPPKGLPESVVKTQSKKPLDMPTIPENVNGKSAVDPWNVAMNALPKGKPFKRG